MSLKIYCPVLNLSFYIKDIGESGRISPTFPHGSKLDV